MNVFFIEFLNDFKSFIEVNEFSNFIKAKILCYCLSGTSFALKDKFEGSYELVHVSIGSNSEICNVVYNERY